VRRFAELGPFGESVIVGKERTFARKAGKMKPNTVIHTLLGTAVLTAVVLLYVLLARPSQPALSPQHWLLFGGGSLALVLAAFLPTVVRRLRGFPPEPVSAADVRFSIALAAAVCPLVFFAVWGFGPFGSFLILLVPLASILRSSRRGLLKHR
jgi:hypothetical protein